LDCQKVVPHDFRNDERFALIKPTKSNIPIQKRQVFGTPLALYSPVEVVERRFSCETLRQAAASIFEFGDTTWRDGSMMLSKRWQGLRMMALAVTLTLGFTSNAYA